MDLEKGTASNVLDDSSSIKHHDPSRTTSYIHDFNDIVIDPNDPGEIQVANIRRTNGVLRHLRNLETWMDRKMKFEAMGVERIPEDKRKPPQILNVRKTFISNIQPLATTECFLHPTDDVLLVLHALESHFHPHWRARSYLRALGAYLRYLNGLCNSDRDSFSSFHCYSEPPHWTPDDCRLSLLLRDLGG